MRLAAPRTAPQGSGAAMSLLEESRPFAQQLSNVYFTILSLFCFKLFVKISLAILSHFYIVKGNRKEAARIAAEFYGVTQGQGMFTITLCRLERRLVMLQPRPEETSRVCFTGRFKAHCVVNVPPAPPRPLTKTFLNLTAPGKRKSFCRAKAWVHKIGASRPERLVETYHGGYISLLKKKEKRKKPQLLKTLNIALAAL